MTIETIFRPSYDEYGYPITNHSKEVRLMPKQVIESMQGYVLKPGTPENVQKAAEPFLSNHANYSA